ncbi:MAG: triose-phosphate isomerase [Syntrophobacteraceae bacterium]|nr:triose-phosphate isomerase [Syntrophobacteraceae bacterium]
MNPDRRPLIAANWKMHKTLAEAVSFVESIQKQTGPLGDREVLIAPPFTSLKEVGDTLKEGGYSLGAQNCHWEQKGAFTGEISTVMLKEMGCAYVLVGHSERRQLFGETDETVRLKTAAVIAAGMVPVVCVGEVLGERERGETFDVVGRQVEEAFTGLSAEQMAGVVIAYEPVWAIGTGKTATAGQAQEVHGYIRARISSLFNKTIENNVRILYGGSVKPSNIDVLMAEPDIDGALVGGASLEVASFTSLIEFNV